MDIRMEVKAFLASFLKNYDLGDEEDIFALGLVNSLFAMQLVQFVERQFEITVENEDLDMENFRTIGALTRFVHRKQALSVVIV